MKEEKKTNRRHVPQKTKIKKKSRMSKILLLYI